MEPRQKDQARLESGAGMSALDQDANAGTTAVRDAYRFDEAALARWMAAHVDGYAGPLTVEQFKGGQSNPTYKLVTPGAAYVLRRKPPGPVLKGAHAVDREARILTALGRTGFPVAHIHGLCTDDSVIGSWFYVMEMVEGRIFWDATFPGVKCINRLGAYAAARTHLHPIQITAVEIFVKFGLFDAAQQATGFRYVHQTRGEFVYHLGSPYGAELRVRRGLEPVRWTWAAHVHLRHSDA